MDDEVAVARSLQRWLTRRGAQVVVINDPREVEEALLRVQPTWIISDYLMPERDGVEVLELARRVAPEVRRCLLTGSLAEVSLAKRAQLEPCLFFEKPWDSPAFAAALGLAPGGAP